ncbi:MAG: hypothetical protein OXC46_06725 [Thaumarchaeota archaeon]|nr:hypothetical protein [Nitrososphaerota archaeon]
MSVRLRDMMCEICVVTTAVPFVATTVAVYVVALDNAAFVFFANMSSQKYSE